MIIKDIGMRTDMQTELVNYIIFVDDLENFGRTCAKDSRALCFLPIKTFIIPVSRPGE